MGCWGITAFESDAGLDTVELIRRNLPEDGRLELEKIIEILRQDNWSAPPDVTNGESHTSPMALAEIVVKLLDQDMEGLDYTEKWVAQNNKFSSVNSFSTSKESVQWLHDYISDTLKYARENAANGRKWSGWFQEQDWNGWQKHMEGLIGRLDMLLTFPENSIELALPQEQGNRSITNREKEENKKETGMKSKFLRKYQD